MPDSQPYPLFLWPSPTSPPTLHGVRSLRLVASEDGPDESTSIGDYTVTLNNYVLPTPTPVAGAFEIILDTEDFFNGTQVLRADATHGTLGPVFEEFNVTIDNGFANNVTFQAIGVPEAPEGTQYVAADVGLKSFPVPDVGRRQTWMQSRLLTDEALKKAPSGTPQDLQTVGDDDLANLGKVWEAGLPVVLQNGQRSDYPVDDDTPTIRPAFQWRWAPDQRLASPGKKLWWLIRQERVEVLSWWVTHYDLLSKARRDETNSTEGAEIWHFLGRKSDDSSAAILQIEISGTLDVPTVAVSKYFELLNSADAIDYAIVGTKIYVLRETTPLIRVFDLDSPEITLDIGIAGETRKPLLVENVAGDPIVVCVDAELAGTDLEPRSVGYKLKFDAPVKAWSLHEAASHTRYVPAPAAFFVAAEDKIYQSAAGESFGAPFECPANITCLGTSTDGPLAGLEDGKIYGSTGSGWELLATLPSSATAVGGWKSNGENIRNVGGRDYPQLFESLVPSSTEWAAGTLLVPPAGTDADEDSEEEGDAVYTIDSVTFLEGIERIVTPASGTLGEPDFQPAVVEYRLLIGTNNDGLVGSLQRSRLSAARGAFLAWEYDQPYLVGTTAPKV